MPAIPLVAAGVGGLFGLIGAKKQASAMNKQTAAISPLIQSQADASRFSLDQAKTDLPAARAALKGPLDFWNNILSGNRNAMSSVLGPENDVIAGRDALATRNLSEFAPRGGRRTLMLGEQPFTTATDYNKTLLALRPQAAGQVTGLGQILAQLGLGEQGAGTGAGSSAIQGGLGLANLANQGAGGGYNALGGAIGQALLALQKWKFPGSIGTGTVGGGNGGTPPFIGGNESGG